MPDAAHVLPLPRLQPNTNPLLLFLMLFQDALISVMARRLPTTPQTPNPGLASQSSSPSHRCRERGLLLFGGLYADHACPLSPLNHYQLTITLMSASLNNLTNNNIAHLIALDEFLGDGGTEFLLASEI